MSHIEHMNESAFRAFYESTRKALWAYIVKMVDDQATADDILQESYIRLLRADTDKLHESQRKAYLYRIATNLVNDHWRKKNREQRVPYEEGEHGETDPTDAKDMTQDVAHAFRQLSSRQRSLLWLAYVEEYNHQEIAGMLKLSKGSIKVLLFRAKQKLIATLKSIGIVSEKT